MATSLKNLSDFRNAELPSAKGMKIGIAVAEWNSEVTYPLLKGATDFLLKNGAIEDDIIVVTVPGTFELTSAAKTLADKVKLDAVIVIGCVIQGETRHFDFICHGVTQGITELNLKYNIPFIFGVLTTDNQQQALDRAGGKHGNKGDEAAYTAIKMVAMSKKL